MKRPKRRNAEVIKPGDARTRPDYTKKCTSCDATPVVPLTGLCGPCTFGEAATADGKW